MGSLVDPALVRETKNSYGFQILRVPRASTFAVYSGASKLTATWLCAPSCRFHLAVLVQ